MIVLCILAIAGVITVYLLFIIPMGNVLAFLGGCIQVVDNLWFNRYSEDSLQERFKHNYHLGWLGASLLYYDKLMFLIWPLMLAGYLIVFSACLISLILYVWLGIMELWGKMILARLN
ncbi:MAG: hypothetical protein WC697_02175 [Patescibacteria group bacterium]|jgi:hypothetical protein